MNYIEIPSWGTVTLIEAIWLASGLLALLFALLRVLPLVLDWRDSLAAGEDDLCVIARGYLRREFIRIAQALCIISIGLYAATQGQAIPGPARTTSTGLILTGVLILISLLVSLQSFLDWRDREFVREFTRRSQ